MAFRMDIHSERGAAALPDHRPCGVTPTLMQCGPPWPTEALAPSMLQELLVPPQVQALYEPPATLPWPRYDREVLDAYDGWSATLAVKARRTWLS